MMPPTTDKQDGSRWQDDREFWVDQLTEAERDLRLAMSRVDDMQDEIDDCKTQIERIDAMSDERPGGDA